MKPDLPNLRALALEVSLYLPEYYLADDPERDTWDKDEHLITGSREYVRGNTKGIRLRFCDGRLHVNCLWPNDDKSNSSYYPRDSKSITVAANRPAEAIAKDIQRRLLVWYDGEWAAAVIRRAESEVYIDTKEAFGKLCAEIMGRAVCVQECHGTSQIRMSCGNVGIEIDNDSDGAMKFRGPAWQFEKILRAIAATGAFDPVCENTECLKPATQFIEKHWGGKNWY